MANTFVKIQTITVGSGGAASIDFTSIPQTFTDLCVKMSLRMSGGGHFNSVFVRFNNSSSSVYSNKRLYGYSNAAASAGASSQTSININWSSSLTATANVFGSGELYIPNYTGSTNKTLSSELVSENNNATEAITGMGAGLFADTTAITQVNIIGESSFVQYSSATLYGIKNT
jgi:hypothetical protein